MLFALRELLLSILEQRRPPGSIEDQRAKEVIEQKNAKDAKKRGIGDLREFLSIILE